VKSERDYQFTQTRLGLLLFRFFALLLASLFAFYSYSWFVSGTLAIAGLIGLSALVALILALLPSRLLDGLLIGYQLSSVGGDP
jgi:hypothetical protein